MHPRKDTVPVHLNYGVSVSLITLKYM